MPIRFESDYSFEIDLQTKSIRQRWRNQKELGQVMVYLDQLTPESVLAALESVHKQTGQEVIEALGRFFATGGRNS